MRLSLASNFDESLIDAVSCYPVDEVFGKLSSDLTGGGRASYQTAGVSRKRLARHVGYAKGAGIRFNYLLNAACLDNREFTRFGQRKIRKLLDWLVEVGVSAVTVASPFLLEIVKKSYPELSTRVSVFAGVDDVRKAQMWEDCGADCIMLDSLLVNREFSMLRSVRQAVSCDLSLMVNNSCLQSCAFSPYHMTTLAHASQSKHHSKGFFIDWCLFKCTQMKLQDPVNYLRSEWIRPEDLHHYEELGFDNFKITERGAPTAVLVKRVKAYAERSYDGNLLDLVQPFGFSEKLAGKPYDRKSLLWRMRYVFRPFIVSPRKLLMVLKLAKKRGMLESVAGEAPVYVDNRALDGFIELFKERSCKDVDCESCRHCHRFAAEAVRVDATMKDDCLGLYRDVFYEMSTGGMWGVGKAKRSARP